MSLIDVRHAVARMTIPRRDEVTFGLIGSGDTLGELSLLRTNHRLMATVGALDP